MVPTQKPEEPKKGTPLPPQRGEGATKRNSSPPVGERMKVRGVIPFIR